MCFHRALCCLPVEDRQGMTPVGTSHITAGTLAAQKAWSSRWTREIEDLLFINLALDSV